MSVAGTITASIAIPLIMKAIGGALAKKGAGTAATKLALSNPAARAAIAAGTGRFIRNRRGVITGVKIPGKPASKGLQTAGKAMSLPADAAQTILPFALLAGGGLTKGVGQAAGAGLQGLGAMAGGLRTPEAKRQLYGRGPGDVGADILEPLGRAAGQGVAAVTGTVGDATSGLGKTMAIGNIMNRSHNRAMKQALEWQKLGLSPSTAGIVQRQISAGGRGMP
jgi:hypothetical protein